MQLTTPAARPPLGTNGDMRLRLLLHHAPLALVSAVVLVLFMTVSPFDANKYLLGDLFSGSFPKDFPAVQTEAGADGAGHQIPPDKLEQIRQSGGHAPPPDQGGGQTFLGLDNRRFTVGTGYVATGLLGLTLLIGPVNLMLGRRNPISSYLTRDVGTWAIIGSVVHVIFALELHARITDPLPMFFLDGSPLTNSFGWGNWTGLAALVIAVGLLAISSDFALKKLKARTWKNLQRLNYALFALVIAHAFFYGALLRTDSPYTLLLLLSVIAAFVGQSVGVWLWRRRHAGRAAAGQPA
jgi:sulfoxide reductase heme-binding subunit YedZ